MTTQEIKTGLRFKLTDTGRTYEVTKVSDSSVFFKDVTMSPEWRQSKKTFLEKFQNGFEKI